MITDLRQFQAFSDKPISLMSEAGDWIAPFELKLNSDELKTIYQKLLAARMLDERMMTLQRMGKISFVAPAAGHEGAQVGTALALRPKHDWLFQYYRDHGMLLALGVPMQEILAQAMSTQADPTKGRQMPGHPNSKEFNAFVPASAIASHIPPAVGAALSMKLQGSDQVTMCSFGDGATSEGDWHAGVNFAGSRGAPIVFVCENNQYAISLKNSHQTASETIAMKAKAYGMPGYYVDGMDVLACYFVMLEALERARQGLGPSLVEMLVYRYGAHSSSDDDSSYRPVDEVKAWKQRDPLRRMQRFLEKRGLWSDSWQTKLKTNIEQELSATIQTVAAAGKVPLAWMFDDVYADMLPHLAEQRDELLN